MKFKMFTWWDYRLLMYSKGSSDCIPSVSGRISQVKKYYGFPIVLR